jgi:hypothetical protein
MENILKNTFIILVMKIFLELRGSNFEHGLQTELCNMYGIRYGIKGSTLMEYVSYVKCYNKINSSSFKIGKRYHLIIEQLNAYTRSELEELLLLVNREKDLDLLSYLTKKGGR